jgi:hypothetical protein
MNAIHIRRKLESVTLDFPELQPFLGKTVQITVEEATMPGFLPGTGDWDAAEQAVRSIKDFDYDAQTAQDECDLQNANGVLTAAEKEKKHDAY